MTRKLVIVNMSTWADEAYKVLSPGGSPEGRSLMLSPGEYAVLSTTESEGLTVHQEKVGLAIGYEPPTFPAKAISDSQEENK